MTENQEKQETKSPALLGSVRSLPKKSLKIILGIIGLIVLFIIVLAFSLGGEQEPSPDVEVAKQEKTPNEEAKPKQEKEKPSEDKTASTVHVPFQTGKTPASPTPKPKQENTTPSEQKPTTDAKPEKKTETKKQADSGQKPRTPRKATPKKTPPTTNRQKSTKASSDKIGTPMRPGQARIIFENGKSTVNALAKAGLLTVGKIVAEGDDSAVFFPIPGNNEITQNGKIDANTYWLKGYGAPGMKHVVKLGQSLAMRIGAVKNRAGKRAVIVVKDDGTVINKLNQR